MSNICLNSTLYYAIMYMYISKHSGLHIRVKEMKNINKKKLIYFVLLGIFIVSFLFISVLYLVRKNNTSIIIQGDPRNIALEGFEGNLDFVTITLNATGGSITNEDAVSFDINGKTYSAQPHDLVIEFKSAEADDLTDGIPGSITNPQMHFTPIDSTVNSTFADFIEIKKGDRLTESFTDESGSDHKTVVDNIEVTMKDFTSFDSLHIWSDLPLEADSNTVIIFKGETISDNGAQIVLHDNCIFSFENITELSTTLTDSIEDFHLSGTIKKLSGTLENDGAELYSTSGASQNSFFCGNQSLLVAGKELKSEYTYDAESADLVVSGKPTAARLEDIDVMEGFLQYLITNFDAFFMALFGALLALVIDKTVS